MSILLLVRNFVPAHEQIMAGEWDVAAIAKNAYDLEGKVIGTLGAGRIGFRVLQRLLPFDPKELLYCPFRFLRAGMGSELTCGGSQTTTSRSLLPLRRRSRLAAWKTSRSSSASSTS